MPGRWVSRKALNGETVSEPLACFVAHAIVAEPGLRSVDQCIKALLKEGEEAVGDGDSRQIVKDGIVVGFMDISHRIT
jgi:hypothetical protein